MRRLHLIESGHAAHGGGAHAFLSFSAHFALVVAALYATTRPAVAREDVPDPRVYFVPEAPVQRTPQVREAPAPEKKSPGKSVQPAQRAPVASPVVPPVGIPEPGVALPDPSLPGPLVPEQSGATGAGTEVAGGGKTGPYEVGEVEIPAAPLSKGGPDYPERALRLALSGSVTARFVVDAAGRVESDVGILDTTGPEFTSAVKSFLRRARYRPARVGGQAVRQMVEQRFVFELRG